MTITIDSTTKIVEMDGVPCRVWEGETDSGIKVHCYIARVAIDINSPANHVAQFEKELKQRKAPSAVIEALPMRLML
jgi:hypothetical protein